MTNVGLLKRLLPFICWTFAGIHPATGVTVLTGARIIDGTGRTPLENGVLVFEGDRILGAGPADTVQRPPGAEIIDLSGKTIIPALISAHSHLGLCKGIIGPRPENLLHTRKCSTSTRAIRAIWRANGDVAWSK